VPVLLGKRGGQRRQWWVASAARDKRRFSDEDRRFGSRAPGSAEERRREIGWQGSLGSMNLAFPPVPVPRCGHYSRAAEWLRDRRVFLTNPQSLAPSPCFTMEGTLGRAKRRFSDEGRRFFAFGRTIYVIKSIAYER
jgi:hypothetical protein